MMPRAAAANLKAGGLLPARAVLHQASELSVLRRAGRVVAVRPESGAWMEVAAPLVPLLHRLRRPTPVAELLAGGLPRAEVLTWIQAMYDRGLLAVNGRAAPAPLPAPPELRLRLHVVDGCAPACPECAAASPRAMPPEVGRRALQQAARASRDGPLLVEFVGGEPLRAFPAVRDLVAEARALSASAALVVHTGGVDVEPAQRAFLAEHEVDLALTQKWGQTTLFSFTSLTPWLAAGVNVVPCVVVAAPEDYEEAFARLTGLGFRHFRTTGAALQAGAAPVADGEAEALAGGLLRMVDRANAYCGQTGACLRISDVDRMLQKLTGRRLPERTLLSVHPDGTIYAGEAWHLAEPGRLQVAAIGDPAGRPERRPDGIVRCARCPFRGLCAGGSMERAIRAFGTPEREDPMCRYLQVAYEGLIWRIVEDPAIVERLAGPSRVP